VAIFRRMPAFRIRTVTGFAKTLRTSSVTLSGFKTKSFNRTLAIITASGGSQDATVSTLPQAKGTTTQRDVVTTGSQVPQPAFPEAEGYGGDALAGVDRTNQQLFTVSNLGNSGAGSLRQAFADAAAASNDVFKIIIFTVGGYITLNSRIDVSGLHNCYVAGQTAPGDGITIRGVTGIRLNNNCDNIVIRYIRFRIGFDPNQVGGSSQIALSLKNIRNWVVDHCSFSWTMEKHIALNPNILSDNGSIQFCTFGEALANEPTSMQISGVSRTNPESREIDVHHNYFISNSHRNGQFVCQQARFVNNVTYNWLQGGTQLGGGTSNVDVINNSYRTGPFTDSRFHQEVSALIKDVDKCTVSIGANPEVNHTIYLAGNIGPHNTDVNALPESQWTGTNRVVAGFLGPTDPGCFLPTSVRRDSKLTESDIPITTQLANAAQTSVLSDVGANRRLAGDGSFTIRWDSTDSRYLQSFSIRSGINAVIASEDSVGGFPTLAAGTPYTDTNADGIGDAWATANMSGGDSANSLAVNGYTFIEHFLNGTLPA